MSAFIVEPKTIDRIVTVLERESFYQTRVDLKEMGLVDPQGLGLALMDMNVDAVNQRYNESRDPATIKYIFRPAPVSSIQSLKSLNCWLYQCAEGNVPQQRLYKIMNEMARAMSGWIIFRMPEYQAAEWG